jgi:hypothetical protein
MRPGTTSNKIPPSKAPPGKLILTYGDSVTNRPIQRGDPQNTEDGIRELFRSLLYGERKSVEVLNDKGETVPIKFGTYS